MKKILLTALLALALPVVAAEKELLNASYDIAARAVRPLQRPL